jgi:chromosomal replication initiation ATPase DnaA
MTRENFWEKYGRSDNYIQFMSDLKTLIYEERKPKSEKADMILAKVCECLSEPLEEVKSKSRVRQLAEARFCFYRIANQEMGIPIADIGRFIGRNHCGVIYGIAQTRDVPELIKKYSKVLNYVKKYI